MRNLNAKIFKLYVPKILDSLDLKKSMETELFNISNAFNDLYNLTDTSNSIGKTITSTYTLLDNTPQLISTININNSENYPRTLLIELPYLYKTVTPLGETDTNINIELKDSSDIIIGSASINGVGFNQYEASLPKVIANINVGYLGEVKVYINLSSSGTIDPVIFNSRSSDTKLIATLTSNIGDIS